MGQRKRDSLGRFAATQIVRLVSERPDLPAGIVEVANPPYSWKKTVKKGLIAAAPVFVATTLASPEDLSLLFGLSPASAAFIWIAGNNLGKQRGWWGRVK